MKTRSILLPVIVCAALCGLQPGSAQTNELTISLDNNGSLSWTSVSNSAGYVILWAPSASGPWSTLANLPTLIPTGTVNRLSVPMFYRMASVEYTNTLLIHGDGGAWSALPVDVGGHPVSLAGGAQTSTNASRFGNSSIGFNGITSYLSAPASSDWAFGTGDFTVDFWANFSSVTGTNHFIGSHSKGIGADWVFVSQPDNLGFYINDLPCVITNWIPATNNWYHIAATRSAGTVRMFINGSQVGANTSNASIPNRYNLTIGAAVNSTFYFSGYLDEIRIRKGFAAWTNNFTPPSAAYLP